MTHHHSALRYLMPTVVHHGQAERVLDERHRVRMAAYLERPERFVNGPPRLETLPGAVWINPPEKTTPQIAPGSTKRREDDPEVVPVLTSHAPITRPGVLVTRRKGAAYGHSANAVGHCLKVVDTYRGGPNHNPRTT